MIKHTPTPWQYNPDPAPDGEMGYISGQRHAHILSLERTGDGDANAEFIILACNLHDELVGNLEYMICFIKMRSWKDMAENVINTEVEALDALLAKVREPK